MPYDGRGRGTAAAYGIRLRIIRSTNPQYYVEVQRKTAGDFSTVYRLLPSPSELYELVDPLPYDSVTRYYRARQYSDGYDAGPWSSVISGTPSPIGDETELDTWTRATQEEISDGWSAAQNAAAPENGNVTLTLDGDDAFSNLEDANSTSTTYTAWYDIDATGMAGEPGGPNLATVTLYANDGPGSTNWTSKATDGYDETSNYTNESLSFTAALGANYDLKLVLTYQDTPTAGYEAVVTAHGEDNAQPGVTYTKVGSGALEVTSAAAGDTIYASAANTLAMLGIGAAGTLYMSNGTAPTWATTLTGNYTWSGTQLFNGAITVASTFAVDTISEKTAAAGVTIDGVLLKDSLVGWSYVDKTGSELNDIVDHNITVDSNWEPIIDEDFEFVSDLAA